MASSDERISPLFFSIFFGVSDFLIAFSRSAGLIFIRRLMAKRWNIFISFISGIPGIFGVSSFLSSSLLNGFHFIVFAYYKLQIFLQIYKSLLIPPHPIRIFVTKFV